MWCDVIQWIVTHFCIRWWVCLCVFEYWINLNAFYGISYLACVCIVLKRVCDEILFCFRFYRQNYKTEATIGTLFAPWFVRCFFLLLASFFPSHYARLRLYVWYVNIKHTIDLSFFNHSHTLMPKMLYLIRNYTICWFSTL